MANWAHSIDVVIALAAVHTLAALSLTVSKGLILDRAAHQTVSLLVQEDATWCHLGGHLVANADLFAHLFLPEVVLGLLDEYPRHPVAMVENHIIEMHNASFLSVRVDVGG